ncbi:MAG: MATE family efflux transporter [Curvibacter sp. GWA2_64_110]|nr:MAG: MATE family efflux transporter [Curvibacter sp. GWA2_64_110]HCY14532.1 MATE family efflux transporter [Curvibacter sp.]
MSELKTISRHAGTVLVGQLATMAFGVTDTIVAGRYAEASLAALSVGAAIYMSVYVALMGVLQALLPVWAELHGAQKPRQLGFSFRQSLYLCAALMAFGMVILLQPAALLDWAEVPATLRGEVLNYLSVLALALPPALLFRLYSTLNQSLGRPLLVTWLQIGSLFLKVPLSIWFAFGGAGLEAQGAVGCALATLAVQYLMLALALWLLRSRELYRPYHLWHKLEKPHGPTLVAFARVGVPSGLTILVEVTSFTLMALFVARLGTTAAASHQIAANLAAVLYMVPLAIGIATSARTSYWLGAGQPRQARHAVGLGFMLVLGCAVLLAGTLIAVREPLVRLYARSPEVIALAVPLLAWTAAFHLFDGLQALGVFILRCFRITLSPFLIYGVLLWGLGLYGGYQLAYHGLGPWPAMQSPAAFWITGMVALTLTALIFWLMIWQVLKR